MKIQYEIYQVYTQLYKPIENNKYNMPYFTRYNTLEEAEEAIKPENTNYWEYEYLPLIIVKTYMKELLDENSSRDFTV
jgi:hypothetical protein